MNSLLLCFLVVLLPFALALQCKVCTNLPAQAGISGKPCSDPDFLECPLDMNRCMTLEFKMTILGASSLDITLKNCSNARICAPDFMANFCKGLNSTVTGLMSSCTSDCCQGDNCNGVASAGELPGSCQGDNCNGVASTGELPGSCQGDNCNGVASTGELPGSCQGDNCNGVASTGALPGSCQGDNCNGIASGAEVAGLSVWLASFTAILMALYQKFLN